MPCYTTNLNSLFEEIGVSITKSTRVRLDQYIQEILGTVDADCDTVWPLLHTKLQDPEWTEQFRKQLKAKWDARDWREGLLS
ncbi:MAG: hypothetical protein M1132_09690 [Chloroflexi bacterium]|nr:hypothetical protein [Chloroflexota bacterium]MCL5951975.1 hypothetical protein [Chloroflexota bacterium]